MMNTSPLLDICIRIFFSHTVVYVFIFLTGNSNEHKCLMLMMSNLSLFFFIISPFCVLRDLCLPLGHKDSLLCFFPRSFVVVAFTLRSVVHSNSFLSTVWSRDQGSCLPHKRSKFSTSSVLERFLSIKLFGYLWEFSWSYKGGTVSGFSFLFINLFILLTVLSESL